MVYGILVTCRPFPLTLGVMKKSHIERTPLVIPTADAATEVLLIHAPYPAQPRFDSLPSSLLSACELLLLDLAEEGVRAGLLDPVSSSEEFYETLEAILAGGAARVALVSTSTAAIEETARIVALARRLRPEVLIVVGGPHEDYCELKVAEALPAVDVSIAGEAGDLLRRIVLAFLEQATGSSCDGGRLLIDALAQEGLVGRGEITTRAWGEPHTRPYGSIPSPVHSFLATCAPTKSVRFDVFPDRDTIPLMISRGCAYGQCTFCSEGGPGVRLRLVDDFGWVERLIAGRPGSALYFQDSIFPSNRRVQERLLPLLRETGVPWGCQTYLPMLSERWLELLERHGCTYVYTGIESGSDALLEAVGKRELTRKLIEERLGWFVGRRTRLGLSLMFGMLSERGELLETDATISETMDLLEALAARRVPIAGIYPNIHSVLPGTPLARSLAAAGACLDFYDLPRAAIPHGFEEGPYGYNYVTLGLGDALQRRDLHRALANSDLLHVLDPGRSRKVRSSDVSYETNPRRSQVIG